MAAMHTISFYSYKGGTGRTLIVANIAKYLARFGKKVFALDFDLEAPGLHYKFAGPGGNVPKVSQGVVEYVYRFAVDGKDPEPLAQYVIKLEPGTPGAWPEGSIHLMPAGSAPSAKYWRKLAQINWHELFYSPDAKGVPFFLEFKKRIENEFSPDFLLIDSRTGITEIGGVVTSILPDEVVCLVMNNPESMEGTREVLRSINRAPRLPGVERIGLVPVLTRIPARHEDAEHNILKTLRRFFNEKASDLASTLNIDEILVIHSEPELELAESLRVGGGPTPPESLLLRDYLRLFARLVPKEVIDPYIAPVVRGVLDRAFDDPDSAQKDLESLTANYQHPEAFRALLKLYRLRKADPKLILRAAVHLWSFAGADEPLVWQAVKESLEQIESPEEDPDALAAVEEIWRAAGANDPEITFELADAYEDAEENHKVIRVVEEFLAKSGPTDEILLIYLRVLGELDEWEKASDVIVKNKPQFARNGELMAAWASLLLEKEDARGVEEFLAQESAGLFDLRNNDPVTFARLLVLGNKRGELDAFLREALRNTARGGRPSELLRLSELFGRYGKWEEFESTVKQLLSPNRAAELLDEANRMRYGEGRYRRGRY